MLTARAGASLVEVLDEEEAARPLRRVVELLITLAFRLTRAVIGTVVQFTSAPSADSDDDICVLCMEQKATVMLRPCNHTCFCDSCSQYVQLKQVCECPICRGRIQWMLDIVDFHGFRAYLRRMNCSWPWEYFYAYLEYIVVFGLLLVYTQDYLNPKSSIFIGSFLILYRSLVRLRDYLDPYSPISIRAQIFTFYDRSLCTTATCSGLVLEIVDFFFLVLFIVVIFWLRAIFILYRKKQELLLLQQHILVLQEDLAVLEG